MTKVFRFLVMSLLAMGLMQISVFAEPAITWEKSKMLSSRVTDEEVASEETTVASAIASTTTFLKTWGIQVTQEQVSKIMYEKMELLKSEDINAALLEETVKEVVKIAKAPLKVINLTGCTPEKLYEGLGIMDESIPKLIIQAQFWKDLDSMKVVTVICGGNSNQVLTFDPVFNIFPIRPKPEFLPTWERYGRQTIGLAYDETIKYAEALDITVTINGTKINFDQPPVIQNGSTLVPIRGIFDSLGASTNWDSATQTVTAVKGNTTIVLTIDSNTAFVNGNPIELDVAPTIINGRTLVPARFVSQSLDKNVTWDSASRTVIIIDN